MTFHHIQKQFIERIQQTEPSAQVISRLREAIEKEVFTLKRGAPKIEIGVIHNLPLEDMTVECNFSMAPTYVYTISFAEPDDEEVWTLFLERFLADVSSSYQLVFQSLDGDIEQELKDNGETFQVLSRQDEPVICWQKERKERIDRQLLSYYYRAGLDHLVNVLSLNSGDTFKIIDKNNVSSIHCDTHFAQPVLFFVPGAFELWLLSGDWTVVDLVRRLKELPYSLTSYSVSVETEAGRTHTFFHEMDKDAVNLVED